MTESKGRIRGSIESGANELRRVVRVLAACNESALDPYTAEELLTLTRACWASPWDVYVDDLTAQQREHALRCPDCNGHGVVGAPKSGSRRAAEGGSGVGTTLTACARCAGARSAPPLFIETVFGLCAQGVDDCRCPDCRRCRRVRERADEAECANDATP